MSVPYIPLFIDDFDAATAHLSVAEEGTYMRLMKLAWRSVNCSIIDDLDFIARKTRAPKATIQAILKEFFVLKNGVWTQKRLKREFDDIRKKISARKKSGKLGGLAKSQKNKEKTSSNATLLLQHPEPYPEPYPEPESTTIVDVDSEAGKVVPIRANLQSLKLPADWPGPMANQVLAQTVNSPWLDLSKSGGLQSPAEIARWVTQGCDWSLDVIPTVKAVMAGRSKPVSSWGYFTDAVFTARDTRLKEGPPIPSSERPKRSAEEQELWMIFDDFQDWKGKVTPWPYNRAFPGWDKLKKAVEAFGNAEEKLKLNEALTFHQENIAQ
jgi:uncharacterized protein YdaU (DUF1376 family)